MKAPRRLALVVVVVLAVLLVSACRPVPEGWVVLKLRPQLGVAQVDTNWPVPGPELGPKPDWEIRADDRYWNMIMADGTRTVGKHSDLCPVVLIHNGLGFGEIPGDPYMLEPHYSWIISSGEVVFAVPPLQVCWDENLWRAAERPGTAHSGWPYNLCRGGCLINGPTIATAFDYRITK